MKTFENYVIEYQNLFVKKSEIEKELNNNNSQIVKELLQNEKNKIEKEIKEFGKIELYTKSEYENAKHYNDPW